MSLANSDPAPPAANAPSPGGDWVINVVPFVAVFLIVFGFYLYATLQKERTRHDWRGTPLLAGVLSTIRPELLTHATGNLTLRDASSGELIVFDDKSPLNPVTVFFGAEGQFEHYWRIREPLRSQLAERFAGSLVNARLEVNRPVGFAPLIATGSGPLTWKGGRLRIPKLTTSEARPVLQGIVTDDAGRGVSGVELTISTYDPKRGPGYQMKALTNSFSGSDGRFAVYESQLALPLPEHLCVGPEGRRENWSDARSDRELAVVPVQPGKDARLIVNRGTTIVFDWTFPDQASPLALTPALAAKSGLRHRIGLYQDHRTPEGTYFFAPAGTWNLVLTSRHGLIEWDAGEIQLLPDRRNIVPKLTFPEGVQAATLAVKNAEDERLTRFDVTIHDVPKGMAKQRRVRSLWDDAVFQFLAPSSKFEVTISAEGFRTERVALETEKHNVITLRKDDDEN